MSRRSVLTLGKFDGLHLGHRAIVARLLRLADSSGARSVALVLHPHPAEVLAGRRIPVLTSVEDRLRGLRQLGVQHAEVLPFSRELAALSPQAFIADLAERWSLGGMVMGPDFAFGRDRSGDVTQLRRFGLDHGFLVEALDELPASGERVSSRRIRRLIEAGEVAAARTCLGAPFSLRGTVVSGARRGRQLGYPTANLALTDDYVIPAHGVYAVWASVETAEGADEPRTWLMGAANIGVRPQFDGGARSIEVHVLDFEGDLYDRALRVDFVERLRDEARFADVGALLAQMGRDVTTARRILAAEAPPH